MARQNWQIDLPHSSISFSARHMMISKVRGSFKSWDGTLALDEENPSNSRITAEIDASSIDTGVDKRDDHLRSGDFLDVENHPKIVFESKDVKKVDDEHYTLKGELTIRGTTNPVTLDVEITGRVQQDGGERAGFTATTKINRKDFGITWNKALETGGVLVGDELNVTIEMAADRK